VPVLDAQQELLDGDRRPPVLLLLEQREADGAGEVDFLVEQWGHELHLAVLLLVEQREADGARGARGSRRSGGTAWHELPLSVLLGRWTETNFTDRHHTTICSKYRTEKLVLGRVNTRPSQTRVFSRFLREREKTRIKSQGLESDSLQESFQEKEKIGHLVV
jgi:hypothetical protein